MAVNAMMARCISSAGLVLLVLATTVAAVHFESGFTDKVVIDAQQQVIHLKTKRETSVKHKTQHLKPAIDIEPINEKVRVAMPHFNVQDLTTYATQAAAAIAVRFDEFEPTLLASNGEFSSALMTRGRYTRESRYTGRGKQYVEYFLVIICCEWRVS